MSDADHDAIRAWIGAWNRTDLDFVVGTYAADAEVIPDPGGPDKGRYRGRAAIRKFLEGLREEWEKDEVALTELVDVGDKVLAHFHWRTRGRASGIETEVDVTAVSALDDGKITWQRFYFDHAEALKAVGAGRVAPCPTTSSSCARFTRTGNAGTISRAIGAPEIELVMADGPEPGRWSGFASAAAHWREFLQAWQDTHPQAYEYRELDADRVLVLFRPGGRGKSSGLEVAATGARAATLFDVRGGKVTRVVVYLDHEHAFADLGLTPEVD